MNRLDALKAARDAVDTSHSHRTSDEYMALKMGYMVMIELEERKLLRGPSMLSTMIDSFSVPSNQVWTRSFGDLS